MAYYYFECFEPRPGCGPEDVRRVVGASANMWLQKNPNDTRVLLAGKVLGFGDGFPSYFSIWKLADIAHLDRWIERFAEREVVESPELGAWGTAAVERPAALFADLGEELPMWGVR